MPHLFNFELGEQIDEPFEASLVAIDPEEIDLKQHFSLVSSKSIKHENQSIKKH
jgi:hypothetical protein